jgi:hypothetical protein
MYEMDSHYEDDHSCLEEENLVLPGGSVPPQSRGSRMSSGLLQRLHGGGRSSA